MGAFLKKYIDPLVPLWAIVPLVTCFVFNCAIYWVTMALCADLYHYDFTLEIDRMVPVITEWIYIYLGYSYVFWALGYCYMAHVHRDNPVEIFRFVTADVMSRIVCLLFFIFLPTTNVRPEILGNDISDQLTRFL
ncbi:MAG: phosphatidic acid phosphatase, partial [Eubacterium sp.]|nr:phosphatidic acid phosphatase [Eubacterium sp.]